MGIDEILSLTFTQFVFYLNEIPQLISLDAAIRAPYDPMVDHEKSPLPPIPSFWTDVATPSEWAQAAERRGLKHPGV